jgi:hypothetical protein
MKTALAVSLLFSLSLGMAQSKRQVAASTPPPAVAQAPVQPPSPGLNAILAELRRATEAANLDLRKLRIEKWKADESEKQQMQQVAASLQKNMSMAIPALINEAQAAPGSVSKAFKLYHDINVVYEFLNSISEAAGAYGKKEEYGPLAQDTSALDNARQNLSNYIEQAANTLETQQAKPPAPSTQQQAGTATSGPKKIVIDDAPAPKKTVKKKKAAPTSTPPPSSPQ